MQGEVVVTGSNGMLGGEVVEELKQAGFAVAAMPSARMDITKQASVREALAAIDNPHLLINCAAYTAVDKAESEPEAAFRVNRDGPANLAVECARLGIPLIHISTDYVFNGKSERPYKEDDPTGPINVYGESKWEGEKAVRAGLFDHVIVRSSWMYGTRGQNFVKTMLKLGAEREELTVVNDQYGCPTWSRDLAGCIVKISTQILLRPSGKTEPMKSIVSPGGPDSRIRARSARGGLDSSKQILLGDKEVPWGTYHYCGAGVAAWFDFASAILDEAHRRSGARMATVSPVPTSAYPTAAARPRYSVLDCGKIERNFGISPSPWQKSLSMLMDEFFTTESS